MQCLKFEKFITVHAFCSSGKKIVSGVMLANVLGKFNKDNAGNDICSHNNIRVAQVILHLMVFIAIGANEGDCYPLVLV